MQKSRTFRNGLKVILYLLNLIRNWGLVFKNFSSFYKSGLEGMK